MEIQRDNGVLQIREAELGLPPCFLMLEGISETILFNLEIKKNSI